MTNKEINATLIDTMKTLAEVGAELNKSVFINHHRRPDGSSFFCVTAVDSANWDESYRYLYIDAEDIDKFRIEDMTNA